MKLNKLAIIGGGPSGLAALKWALYDGFDVTLFEQGKETGGQWTQAPGLSGVWDSLHTNSSKYLTAFSDMPFPEDTELYPSHAVVKQYLDDYRENFGLLPCIKLNTTVNQLECLAGKGYKLTYTPKQNGPRSEIFDRVIVASGRFNKPHIPQAAGLDKFTGRVSHAFNYRSNADFGGRRVLVVGNRVTGSDLAADLSLNESVTVISSCRKPKYVVTKLINGEPGDHQLYTRFRSLAANAFPPGAGAQRLKEFIIKSCGNPADFDGLKPAENILEAGVTVSDGYLAQVQKKRITQKLNVDHFNARSVVFADGTEEEIDDVIFATGYELNLPFLSSEIYQAINTGDQHLDLYKYTFHPSFPNLAFIGQYLQSGSFFPSLELQARWITGTWSNHIPAASAAEMLDWIAGFKTIKDRGMPGLHEMAGLVANAAGFEPDLNAFPDLAGSLLFGPLLPLQFRLQGHGSMPGAKAVYLKNNAGKVNSISDLSDEQLNQLKAVAGVLKENTGLQQLIENI
ncbi:NAD(P)-binding domain-containing protein [Mucilaginibacter sp.]|uniref:flavin-containing monooxygenase n=1 Tax=Mucilaginibacter sp. TaxID=1882438 RepID=UPI0025D53D5C|nr:NAD(P)-binding domain-containing protein [Mucilaginibacter sp.]